MSCTKKVLNSWSACLVLLILLVEVKGWRFDSFTGSSSTSLKSMDVSPNERILAVGATSNKIRFWQLPAMTYLEVYDAASTINRIAFSPDSTKLAIGVNSNSVQIVSTSTYAQLGTITTSHGTVRWVDYSTDGLQLVTCGDDNRMKVYNIATGVMVTGADFNFGNSVRVCYISELGQLIGGDSSGNLKSYNADYTAKGTATSTAAVVSLEVIAGGREVMVATSDGWINRRSMTSSTIASTASINVATTISFAAFSRDGYTVAAIGATPIVEIYGLTSPTTYTKAVTLNQFFGNTNTGVMCPSGQHMYVGINDGTIYSFKHTGSGCPSGTAPSSQKCVPCSSLHTGCSLCRNFATCEACIPGYYLSTVAASLGMCVKCSKALTGCATCSSATVCSHCLPTYYLTTSNGCSSCWSALPNCVQCSSGTVCTECSHRYYLNSGGCTLCSNSIANCLVCNSTSLCFQCNKGFYKSATGSSCVACSTNCLDCASSSYCMECAMGYYPLSNVCTACPTNCISCSRSGVCLSCTPGTYLAAGNTCAYCQKPCVTCTTSATTCLSCVAGFYYSGSNVCTACSNGCSICSDSTTCFGCIAGSYLSSTTCSLCSALRTNCAVCTPTACKTCQTGFYESSGSCVNCPDKCVTCATSTDCITCRQGTYLSGTSCLDCSVGCQTCRDGSVCTNCVAGKYLTASNTCSNCPANCETCSSNTVCLSCLKGYYTAGGLCLLCSSITNCVSCSTSTSCNECRLGYKLAVGSASCTQCSLPCSTCDSIGCKSCSPGYYLVLPAQTCQLCPFNCEECTSASLCSSCVVGYYLSGTSCLACNATYTDCAVCSSTACIKCRESSGLILNSGGTCQKCTVSMPQCNHCTSTTLCQQCQYGYALVTGNTGCSSCTTGLANCEHCRTLSACERCDAGYYVNSGNTCSQCLFGCMACTNATYCSKCAPQYLYQLTTAITSTCTKCQSLQVGCRICSSTTACIQCSEGYTLVGSVCETCSLASSQGCTLCLASTCLQCAPNYYLDTNVCRLCSSNLLGCEQCTSSTTCTECNTGFYLQTTTPPTCQTCPQNCAVCSSNTVCRDCMGDYYLVAASNTCSTCEGLFSGCLACTNGACLRCRSGYYLNGGSCLRCTLSGCQICSPTLPTTQCAVCSSLYYLNSGNTCSLCRQAHLGCVKCDLTGYCLQCDTGLYVTASGTCSPCSNRFSGCSVCSDSICQSCMSGYYLNSATSCSLCSSTLQGCLFCSDAMTCRDCQPGYFLTATTCTTCFTMPNCLLCSDASTCTYCQAGYYQQAGTCISCSTTLSNCYQCIDTATCVYCVGAFELVSGKCVALRASTAFLGNQLRFLSQYVNKTTLKHTLWSVYSQFSEFNNQTKDLNLSVDAGIQLELSAKETITLIIKQVQRGTQGQSIIFFTDNPLNLTEGNTIFDNMKTFGRLLEEEERSSLISTEITPVIPRILQISSIPLRISAFLSSSASAGTNQISSSSNFKLKMKKQTMKFILPSLDLTSDLSIRAPAASAQFYASISKDYRSQLVYWYFGLGVIIVTFVAYFIKSVVLGISPYDYGGLIPHILALKGAAFAIYPGYPEWSSYCEGFMVADLPWFSSLLANSLVSPAQILAQPYAVYYKSMSLGGTYSVPTILFVLMIGASALVVWSKPSLQAQVKRFQFYILEMMGLGLAFAFSSSMVAIYYNSGTLRHWSCAFYLLGLFGWLCLLAEGVYAIVKDKKDIRRLRTLVKGTCLSLLHLNPLIILSLMLLFDTCLIVAQYVTWPRSVSSHPYLWLWAHGLVSLSLPLLLILSEMLLSIYLCSLLIAVALLLEIVRCRGEYKEMVQRKNMGISDVEMDLAHRNGQQWAKPILNKPNSSQITNATRNLADSQSSLVNPYEDSVQISNQLPEFNSKRSGRRSRKGTSRQINYQKSSTGNTARQNNKAQNDNTYWPAEADPLDLINKNKKGDEDGFLLREIMLDGTNGHEQRLVTSLQSSSRRPANSERSGRKSSQTNVPSKSSRLGKYDQLEVNKNHHEDTEQHDEDEVKLYAPIQKPKQIYQIKRGSK